MKDRITVEYLIENGFREAVDGKDQFESVFFEKLADEIFGNDEEIINENGVTIKSDDYVIYMSNESYEKLNKEILEELKNKLKK